ncbi:MAG TPA: endonuclease/exonuclease/phosphatase family protein [Longimicrobiales bacterium]|nr:endonuclease/exonuclease/phosphatase family protein [Longimicrobiales bacterium]
MRIATYNFLSGGSARRSGHWSTINRTLRPDILLAQECKKPDRRSFRHTQWIQASERRWGTALVAKQTELRPIAIDGFNGWITGGEFKLRRKLIRIFSIHAPAGKRGYVHTVHQMIDKLAPLARDADLVLGGDFNVAVGFRAPHESVRMSKAERDLMQRFVAELKLIPCWQTANPGVDLAQTLRWTGNRAAPYHCDGIFVPRSWKKRLRSCVVHAGGQWDSLSDHNPVVADFDI